MNESKYAHIFARIKSLENSMISSRVFNQLVEADERAQYSRILSETNYAEDIEKLSLEDFYFKQKNNLYHFLQQVLPDEEFVQTYFLKQDFLNLKLFIKSGNTDFKGYFILKPHLLKNYEDSNRALLPQPFKEILPRALKLAEKSVFEAEIFIDKQMYKSLLNNKNSTWQNYVKNSIDFNNFRLILRCKGFDMNRDFFEKNIIEDGFVQKHRLIKAFTDSRENIHKYFLGSDLFKNFEKINEIYSKENNFAHIEKEIDNALLDFIKKTKTVVMSQDNVVAFVLAVENELKNLKIILDGKANNVPENIIKERLRDSYV
ncbi:MAG: V-type ATPase subunit [Candidatus Muiribacteriota bacterium]